MPLKVVPSFLRYVACLNLSLWACTNLSGNDKIKVAVPSF